MYKKIIFIVICVLFFLTSCTSKPKTPNLNETMSKIEKLVDISNTTNLDENDMDWILNIDKKYIKQFAAKISSETGKSDEIIFIEAIDKDSIMKILNLIDERHKEKIKQSFSYFPKEVQVVEKAIRKSSGNFICYIVSRNAEEINKIYEKEF